MFGAMCVLALALALAAGDKMYLSIGKDGVPVVTDYPRGEAVEYEPGDFERIALGQKNVPHIGLGASKPVAAPADIERLIALAAEKHGLPASLLRAVIAVESSFRADAISAAGAMGLMQLMPGTASDMGVKNPFDPAENIQGGARYLAFLRKHFGDDELALAAYNAGPGRVMRVGGVPAIPETVAYVRQVRTLAASYERSRAPR
jgi:hypothetical protein